LADEGHTRLIWRMRSTPCEWLKPTIVPQLLTKLVDYVAVSENMLGIKERVEGWVTPAWARGRTGGRTTTSIRSPD